MTVPMSMNLQGHYRLARNLHYLSCIPPIGLAALTIWVLPKLPEPKPEHIMSIESYLLGVALIGAVLCDTMFFFRLRRFRELPTRSQQAEVPPQTEVRKGWWACGVAWGLAQVIAFFGVTEAFLTREVSNMTPFLIFVGIILYRCRPRHGLFAAPHWGQVYASPSTDQEEKV